MSIPRSSLWGAVYVLANPEFLSKIWICPRLHRRSWSHGLHLPASMAYYVQLFVCSCSLKLLGWRSFLWQSRFALLVTALRSVRTTVSSSPIPAPPRDGRIIEEVGRYNPMTAPQDHQPRPREDRRLAVQGRSAHRRRRRSGQGRQRGREDRDRRQEVQEAARQRGRGR